MERFSSEERESEMTQEQSPFISFHHLHIRRLRMDKRKKCHLRKRRSDDDEV